MLLLFYLLLTTCIWVSCLWQLGEGKVSCLWQLGEGKVSCLWQRDSLNPRLNVENSGPSVVSERATGATGTGRTAQRVEAQGRLPASRSRGRAKRS